MPKINPPVDIIHTTIANPVYIAVSRPIAFQQAHYKQVNNTNSSHSHRYHPTASLVSKRYTHNLDDDRWFSCTTPHSHILFLHHTSPIFLQPQSSLPPSSTERHHHNTHLSITLIALTLPPIPPT